VRARFAGRDDVTVDELDGLTVAGADWWFNLRPSNTEPLLRLNAEARDAATMAAVRDEVLAVVRGDAADGGATAAGAPVAGATDAGALDPLLAEVIACPRCTGPLEVSSPGDASSAAHGELVCRACAVAYPWVDGVPVLLSDEARPLDGPPAVRGEPA